MFRKGFFVKIEIQLHAVSGIVSKNITIIIICGKAYYLFLKLLTQVTCPGVWLCTHGYLEVTIKTLGYFFRTGAMEPRFPLLCHDKFSMEGYFKSVGSLSDLERVLSAEQVEITLWQNGRRMAYFSGKLADVMHSDIPKLTCEHNINVQLLMKATPAFPGIITPKVELSAHVGVKDRLSLSAELSQRVGKACGNSGLRELEFEATRVPNRHCQQQTSPAGSCFSYLEGRRRQRPVCHTKTSCGSGWVLFKDDKIFGFLIRVLYHQFSSLNLRFTRDNSAVPCSNALNSFDMEAVATKNGARRLSADSSSYNLSQMTRMSSPSHRSHSVCTIASITAADEHQRECHICQCYRKVFS
ncbi:uncharacterized protein LOC118739092 isoform X2 [Rhagoletis pomonella]|uniref:uncharacterized protein LOC118739092 isoform X2 n=1 Tax=Rhagoletis pomonella TaxID=28610 RepID=UPI001786251D|nr:uncharacterized protein LOC118739092 isoform X2 [Rhagoletis pomonella]